MVRWKLIYTKRAQEDAVKIKKAGLKKKTQKLLEMIGSDPYQIPPSFEKLIGLKDIYKSVTIGIRLYRRIA